MKDSDSDVVSWKMHNFGEQSESEGELLVLYELDHAYSDPISHPSGIIKICPTQIEHQILNLRDIYFPIEAITKIHLVSNDDEAELSHYRVACSTALGWVMFCRSGIKEFPSVHIFIKEEDLEHVISIITAAIDARLRQGQITENKHTICKLSLEKQTQAQRQK